MTAITIKTTDAQHTFSATFVDASGNPVTGLTGYGFTWTADDNKTLFSSLGPDQNNVTAVLSGQAGTVNLTCTATKPGSATVTGTRQIIIQGPVPVALDIEMTS